VDTHKYRTHIDALESSIRGLADAVHDFGKISARFGQPVPPVLVDCALDLVEEIKASLLNLKAGKVGVKAGGK